MMVLGQLRCPLCWLPGTSVREIDMMSTVEQAFLLENPRGEYNQ